MKNLQKFAGETPMPQLTAPASYAGEAASGYIAAALLSANTLDKKLITIMPNVKFKSVIQKLSLSNLIQDASCDFTPASSASIAERVLQPDEFQVNLQLCKQEFIDSWNALQLGFSAFDEIPRSFNDYLVSYVAGNVAQAVEESIWQGNGSTNGQFDGFEKLLSASVDDGGATDVLPNTIPNAVYGKQDLVIYIPTNVAKAYQVATAGLSINSTTGVVSNVGANGYQNAFTIGEKPLNFNGIDLVLCPGMSSSKIVAAQKSNLFFGTGLLSDHNEVRVLDMANLDGSQNYRVIMRYSAGVQFGVGQDIVYYGAY